ncbi:HAMP domain-containing sensor histidine kinase [Nocardia otitidiscaviarum]|uniref:HAMP domain-containing sensor histidine kinase n=1 Tax=Nocardia otitidiscaviarum TaxID=1823 RepID=UPI001895E3E1|nr:HAMP domain-containing sensor histidine kinase [Nocardia otitidiscaviarum]MBF6177153.1 HAMP domain-containing histidine kinase [Nocardia otitidiscaviarum]
MLRTRITLVAVFAVTVAIVVTIVTAYRNVSPLVADQVDRGLTDRADTVLALLAADAPLPVRPDMTEQLLLPDGTVLPLVPGRAPLPVTAADRAIAAAGSGRNETEIEVDGIGYGVLTKGRPGGGAVMVSQNYADVERIDREFLWRTAAITAVALLAAALLCWLAIGRILRPIRRLAAATDRIASTQDLTVTLPAAESGEVGELTRSFNTMLAALRFARAQQQRLAEDAGHELRTPLTSVRGSAELLQRARGRLAPEDEAQVLATLVQEAKALDELVRELVDLATDQYAAEEPETLSLAEVARECAHRVRRRSGRTVILTVTDPVPVSGRPRALARCVDNLIANALKFGPPDTPVEIAVCAADLTVRDHGPGIADSDREAVFGRFYRADATRSAPGSGLGLAIVRDIVTAHGGVTHADNHPEGGARVGFRLPAAAHEKPVRCPGASVDRRNR